LLFSKVCSSPVQSLRTEGEHAISIRRRARISSNAVAQGLSGDALARVRTRQWRVDI
jgi:hypothetical protein